MALFDVQRIEILRGPQGTTLRLIGENLTDERTSLREDSLLGVKGSFPEPPRTVYGQLQLGF